MVSKGTTLKELYWKCGLRAYNFIGQHKRPACCWYTTFKTRAVIAFPRRQEIKVIWMRHKQQGHSNCLGVLCFLPPFTEDRPGNVLFRSTETYLTCPTYSGPTAAARVAEKSTIYSLWRGKLIKKSTQMTKSDPKSGIQGHERMQSLLSCMGPKQTDQHSILFHLIYTHTVYTYMHTYTHTWEEKKKWEQTFWTMHKCRHATLLMWRYQISQNSFGPNKLRRGKPLPCLG